MIFDEGMDTIAVYTPGMKVGCFYGESLSLSRRLSGQSRGSLLTEQCSTPLLCTGSEPALLANEEYELSLELTKVTYDEGVQVSS